MAPVVMFFFLHESYLHQLGVILLEAVSHTLKKVKNPSALLA